MAATKRFAKTRRAFLIGTGLVGGALAVGATLAWRRVANAETFILPVDAAKGEAAFNAWLKIAPDSTITVAVPRQDMGQGIYTMLAMYVAEELDADWSKVKVVQAPISVIYGNTTLLADGAPAPLKSVMVTVSKVLGLQTTGGSTSTRDGWMPMRMAAASARSMLLGVAAAKWNVPFSELTIEKSVIRHKSGKSAPIGEFAKDAALLPAPKFATPKPQADWKVLGTSPKRLDVPEKVNGAAQFGIDVRPEGLLYAAVKHINMVSGTLQEVRWKNGVVPKDVLHQVRGSDWLAVIATSSWSAQKALENVELIGGGDNATVLSSDVLTARYNEILDGGDRGVMPGSRPLRREYANRGDAPKLIAAAQKNQVVEAAYSVPLAAHATMEPMNCTVRIANGKVDVWCGNQAPTLLQWLAASSAGVSSDNVTIHTPYLGGGFGRRVDLEVVRQALACAKRTNGKPVQLIWSREQDMRHDAYRPAVSCKFTAVLGGNGTAGVSAWHHKLVGPSVMKATAVRLNAAAGGDFPPDKTNCEGAADLPYDFTNFKVDHAQVDLPVPLGFWRSVGHSFNAFFVESFVDELAFALKKDPYLFRLELLKNEPRFAKVLDAAASAAQWSAPLPSKNWGRGIAIAESFKSIVAQVVDVEIINKKIHVRRVVSAVDCGTALHPDNTKAQISSGAIYGLSAALNAKITLKDGRVEQGNFNDYPMLNLAECPQFETVIVNSGEPLGGIGEVGLPPVAPALANAVFMATGKRLRDLPLSLA
ncbi:MAG: xanthine dehydrogenase family protein molybdopterin-binding subunit [Betaproteobacteria bacterium]|nr:MAG: xanthine dehydrogenase family protein molybdopterin-binding subunit [Betaproteobacteria bacterium]